MGDSFTRQKTQPTVSKYWRERCYFSKENRENANNTKYSNTIKMRHIYNHLVFSVSQKNPPHLRPVVSWHFLHKLLRILSQFFTQLL